MNLFEWISKNFPGQAVDSIDIKEDTPVPQTQEQEKPKEEPAVQPVEKKTPTVAEIAATPVTHTPTYQECILNITGWRNICDGGKSETNGASN